MLMIVRAPGGRAFASFTYPGFIGVLTALSSDRVAVSMNVSNSLDRARRCLPTPLLIRTALEQARTAGDLLARVARGKRCSGFLITAADPKDGGRVLEMTANRSANRQPVGGVLLSTNHFRHELMRPLQGLYFANSRGRLRALLRWLKPRPGRPLGAAAIWRALRRAPVRNSATLMSVLVDPVGLKLRLWEWGMGRMASHEIALRRWLQPAPRPRPRVAGD